MNRFLYPDRIFETLLVNSRNSCLHHLKSSGHKGKTEIYRRGAIHVSRSCLYNRSKSVRRDEGIEDSATHNGILETQVNDDDCFYTRPNIKNPELVKVPESWQDENYNYDSENNGITGPRHSCPHERKRYA